MDTLKLLELNKQLVLEIENLVNMAHNHSRSTDNITDNIVEAIAKRDQALQLQQINIMQSVCEESVIVFVEWLRENCYDTGNKWLYQKNDELYTSKEIYEVYRKECSETAA